MHTKTELTALHASQTSLIAVSLLLFYESFTFTNSLPVKSITWKTGVQKIKSPVNLQEVFAFYTGKAPWETKSSQELRKQRRKKVEKTACHTGDYSCCCNSIISYICTVKKNIKW